MQNIPQQETQVMTARQVSSNKTPLVEIIKNKTIPLEMRSPNNLIYTSQPLKLGKT
jgi:hypothetical protein